MLTKTAFLNALSFDLVRGLKFAVLLICLQRNKRQDGQRQADCSCGLHNLQGGTSRKENIGICSGVGHAPDQLQIKWI